MMGADWFTTINASWRGALAMAVPDLAISFSALQRKLESRGNWVIWITLLGKCHHELILPNSRACEMLFRVISQTTSESWIGPVKTRSSKLDPLYLWSLALIPCFDGNIKVKITGDLVFPFPSLFREGCRNVGQYFLLLHKWMDKKKRVVQKCKVFFLLVEWVTFFTFFLTCFTSNVAVSNITKYASVCARYIYCIPWL